MRISVALTPILSAALLLPLFSAACTQNSGDPFNTNVVTSLPILVSDPANGATGIDVKKIITVSFPVAVDPNTLTLDNVVLQVNARIGAGLALVDRSITFDAVNRLLSIYPRAPLKPNTPYQVIIQGVHAADHTLFSTTIFNFTTAGPLPPPTVRGFLIDPQGRSRPLADAANVDIRSNLQLVFSRAMDPSSVTSVFTLAPRVVGSFSFDPSNITLTFTHPDNPFGLGQFFVVMVGGSATDASINHVPLGTNFVARFSTPQPGNFVVVSTNPPQQTPPAQTQADTPVQLDFGEAVDRTSARQNIKFTPAGASPVLTFANNDTRVFITHANLPANTAVTVTIGKNLTNTVGVTLGAANGGQDFVLNYVISNKPPQLLTQNGTIPANGARGVSPNTKITFNFNEKLDPATVNGTTFTVTRNGNPIAGTVALTPAGQSVAFTPASTIRADPNPVVATATTGIKDLAGNALASNISISFFIDNTPPALADTDPPDGATGVPVNRFASQPLVVDFTKAVDPTATRNGFSISPSRPTTRTGANGVIQFGSQTRLLYTTTTPLLGGTQYTVRISTQDLAGNPTPAPLTFAFTTDGTPPQVNTGVLQPPPGATNVSKQPVISVQFTKQMDLGSLRAAFSLQSQGMTFGTTSGTLVFGSAGTNPIVTTLTYTLNPGVLLPASSVVSINVSIQATDLGLIPLATAFLSTFTTGP